VRVYKRVRVVWIEKVHLNVIFTMNARKLDTLEEYVRKKQELPQVHVLRSAEPFDGR